VEMIAGTNAPSEIMVTTSVGVTTAASEALAKFESVAGFTRVTEQAVRAAKKAGPNSMRVYAPTSAAA